jgi:hypothetical protein
VWDASDCQRHREANYAFIAGKIGSKKRQDPLSAMIFGPLAALPILYSIIGIVLA